MYGVLSRLTFKLYIYLFIVSYILHFLSGLKDLICGILFEPAYILEGEGESTRHKRIKK